MGFNLGSLKNFNINTAIEQVKTKGNEAISKVQSLQSTIDEVKSQGIKTVAEGAIKKAMNLDEIKGSLSSLDSLGNIDPLQGMDMNMLNSLGEAEGLNVDNPEELLKKLGISFK